MHQTTHRFGVYILSACMVNCTKLALGCRSELADSVRQGLTAKSLDATAVITHILKTLEEREHAYL